ncbi:unnamed protein product [Mytilus coruscus]|uniref:Retrotransposon gag domain-containing protein n=1 Tax=Mytilus coruscus TaxID=42192 RepID=A0A6J8AQ86_MYTCO|nr:unnamed protein product [Mytilus coruscus]
MNRNAHKVDRGAEIIQDVSINSGSDEQNAEIELPIPGTQPQPPTSGAPQPHYNQPSARPKEYNSDYYVRQRRSDPGHKYTGDSDTSDVSAYRQTRNKRMSEPEYNRPREDQQREFSPIRSVRSSPLHRTRNSHRRSRGSNDSQSESDTDGRLSKSSRGSRKKKDKIEKRQFLSSIPKTLRYSGKGNWKAFYIKFSGYAKIAEWTDDQKREQLCWWLDDAASEYYTLFLENNKPASFTDISNMNKIFGHQELPETSQVQFQTSAQGEKETLEEWSERVLSLTTRAYSRYSEQLMTEQAIMRFCQGCNDTVAGTEACISKPKSMDAALDMIRWCQHTRKAVSAIQKPCKEAIESISEKPGNSQ